MLQKSGRFFETFPQCGKAEFPTKSRKYARQFSMNHSLKNLVSLVGVVRCGITEIIGKRPYMVQCLTVCALMFHLIDGNERRNLKGRIAQIATSEGKSIIIALLVLAPALLGYFVDVITSTHYLANRDLATFQPLYDVFRVISCSITSDHPKKEQFNGVILYGTNTDFEFAFLCDGIAVEQQMFTVPLDSISEVYRRAQLAIVDESDNLFLDSAFNSARIACASSFHYEWVYKPIYECVCRNVISTTQVRRTLEQWGDGNKRKEAQSLEEDRIVRWITSALYAKDCLMLERDYVKTTVKETGEVKIEIVDPKSTGRISHSSRWSNGLHKFI
jgi:preprotein translocase subunit SecA